MDGIGPILSNTTGKLNIINASNIIHTNAFSQFPFYLDNDQNDIKAITISNYYGNGLITGGKSRIVIKKGDAF